MRVRLPVLTVLLPLALGLSARDASAARHWDVREGTLSVAWEENHLSNLGFQLVSERATSDVSERVRAFLPSASISFATDAPADVSFRTEEGSFVGFDGRVVLPVNGGLGLRTRHPADGRALTPLFLYDFEVVIDAAREPIVASLRAAGSQDDVFVLRNASFRVDEELGEVALIMADVQVSESWASALEQPYLAGQWVGTADLRLAASTNDPVEIHDHARDAEPGPDGTPDLDVTLGQLYGITSQGHIGTYPNGRAGLSAATTSCNTGSVIVPWNAAMQETHPFIGLALFRLQDGVLEMLGKNWLKHGWFALSSNQCNLGCSPSDGTYLGIGCSDTYSAGNNGERYHLGPRSEVNPHLGTWTACGSFFDEPGAPDGDCDRDYFGTASNSVEHRLEVADADLNLPGATYWYEGMYYVANDTKPDNSVGWRECTMTWSGSNWSFSTVGGGVTPTYGPFVATWGDEATEVAVDVDDGPVILSTQVTDNGDGTWHYEYALYNWRSWREVHSFAVPVGGAVITNIDFHDPDGDAGNDWNAVQSGGYVTWSTDDFATDPDANSLEFQSMFNFRFDADVAPVASTATAVPFQMGPSGSFDMDTQAPSGPPTVGVELPNAAEREAIQLAANEPNPFAGATAISFTLPEPRTVRLTVHDVTGRTVRTLLSGGADAGVTRRTWDGRDAYGRDVASGVYFFRLEADGVSRSVKATLRR